MLLILFSCAAIVNCFPANAAINKVLRNKRSEDSVPCEKGWYFFQEKCYKVGGFKSTERLSWDGALDQCKNFGGSLVAIESQEEQDFIVSFLLLDVKYPAWIGLNDREKESTYKWSDGSVVNYTNWNEKEPSGWKDQKEDCVHLLFDLKSDNIGKWNDLSCGTSHAYICQMNKNKKRKSSNVIYCSSQASTGWKFQSSCYYFVTEPISWEDAEDYCKNTYNGHLVTILDPIVDFFLDYMLPHTNTEFWIGIKIRDEIQQKWSSGWYVSYDGFSGEGEKNTEDTCTVRKSRKNWLPEPCSKNHSFICEMSEVNPPILKSPLRGSHCLDKPDYWKDFGGEYCYYIEMKNFLNWHEASFDCNRRGGNLVSLHSKEEVNVLIPFVRDIENTRTIFIGLLRHLIHEGKFVWSDGTPVDFENWSHGEPSHREELCVEAWTNDMSWNDCSCGNKRPYICSAKKIAPNITALEEMPKFTVAPNATALEEMPKCAVISNTTDLEEIPKFTGYVSFQALIGVIICTFLVMILLGVLIYYFKPCGIQYGKNSATVPTARWSLSTSRPKYRGTSELSVKESNEFENMI